MIKWLFLILLPVQICAFEVERPLDSPAQEARAKALFSQLRCLVCDGESIRDSSAELSSNMRGQIRHMVKDNKTDQEILTFFTSRYGSTVLMQPEASPLTIWLWLGPALFVLIGGVLVFRLGASTK